jgi:DNA-binding NtrC family response regulator
MKRKKPAAKKTDLSKNYNPNANEFDYPAQLLNFKKRIVIKTLKFCKGNKSKAALLLKITRPYLYRVMRQTKIK